VLMDVAAVDACRDFHKAINESVTGCRVLLAMIGPVWLDATGDNGVTAFRPRMTAFGGQALEPFRTRARQ